MILINCIVRHFWPTLALKIMASFLSKITKVSLPLLETCNVIIVSSLWITPTYYYSMDQASLWKWQIMLLL